MDNKGIKISPIGIIHTPYKTTEGMPIQGKFEKGVVGQIEVYPQYTEGLKDIEEFSHLILIWYFDRSTTENLISRPFLEDKPHGIFAIRGPHRPNHIALSIVKVERVEKSIITFSEVDMLDGTPLLDIKPYISHFDSRENVKNGWLQKHFKNGNIPGRARI